MLRRQGYTNSTREVPRFRGDIAMILIAHESHIEIYVRNRVEPGLIVDLLVINVGAGESKE
jgi:hypothetical protein